MKSNYHAKIIYFMHTCKRTRALAAPGRPVLARTVIINIFVYMRGCKCILVKTTGNTLNASCRFSHIVCLCNGKIAFFN